ncbi:MAG: signal peptidase I [Candidatus Eremiobacteraeota bacterium]|nr:signal peptidase I [Candidatus Eremiobacteraeota bacterium]MBV8584340.1 signal peptidase I [Candidatus Eremiobacteraeota bacterium]
MTPFQLLAIVAGIAVLRGVLSLRPVIAGTSGRSTSIAREFLDPFIVAGVAAWVLITFVARTYYIPSGSMLPTLQIHDVLLVDKFEYRFHPPKEGDIVVFPPPIPTPDDFIKRVIGRPGDTLSVTAGTVLVNGRGLVEPYVADRPAYELAIRNYGIYVSYGAGWQRLDPASANVPPKSMWTAPDRIPPHCYIMFGDNRNDSEDSHIWGFAQDGATFASGPRKGESAGFTGRAFLIFWPPSQARVL